jgi:hypothetical protein
MVPLSRPPGVPSLPTRGARGHQRLGIALHAQKDRTGAVAAFEASLALEASEDVAALLRAVRKEAADAAAEMDASVSEFHKGQKALDVATVVAPVPSCVDPELGAALVVSSVVPHGTGGAAPRAPYATYVEALDAILARPDGDKAKRLASMMLATGDAPTHKDRTRDVIVFEQAMDAAAHLEPDAFGTLLNDYGNTKCVRCLKPVAVACEACGYRVFCSAACSDAAWWHRTCKWCETAATKRKFKGDLNAAFKDMLAGSPAESPRARQYSLLVESFDGIFGFSVDEQRQAAALADTLAFSLWAMGHGHELAHRRLLALHGLNLMRRVTLPHRTRAAARIAELADVVANSLGVIGFTLFDKCCRATPAADDMEKRPRGRECWEWLPRVMCGAVLPLIPDENVVGGKNDHGPRPTAANCKAFFNVTQSLAMNYGLDPAFSQTVMPDCVVPLMCQQRSVLEVMSGESMRNPGPVIQAVMRNASR